MFHIQLSCLYDEFNKRLSVQNRKQLSIWTKPELPKAALTQPPLLHRFIGFILSAINNENKRRTTPTVHVIPE